MPKLLRRRFSGGGGSGATGFTLAGKLYIPTTESTSSTSDTYLTTPDRIQNVVLPTDALIAVIYQALWRNDSTQAARASVYVGANKAKVIPSAGGAPGSSEGTGPSTINSDAGLATGAFGLVGNINAAGTTEVLTGQAVTSGTNHGPGSLLLLFGVPAGTYDVGIQFRSQVAGTVTAKSRRLWVGVIG